MIVPVYKCESYLVRAVNSVLLQPCADLVELILIDDGSPDQSGAICDQLAADHLKQIRVIHQENQGVAAARNYGIDLAKGHWLAFLDSDDWWQEGFLDKRMCQALRESESFDLIEFAYRRVSTDYRYTKPFPVIERELKDNIPDHEFAEGAHWKYFYRREFILKEDLRYFPVETGEDVPFIELSIQFSSSLKTIDRLLYNYFFNPASIVHSGFSEKSMANRVSVVRRKGEILAERGIPFEMERTELSYIAVFLPKLCMHYSFSEVQSILSDPLYDVLRDASFQPWKALQPVIAQWRTDPKRYWRKAHIWPGKKNELERIYLRHPHLRRFIDSFRFQHIDRWPALSEQEYQDLTAWLNRCEKI